MKKWMLLVTGGSLLSLFGCGDSFWQTAYWWFDIGSTVLQDAAALNLL